MTKKMVVIFGSVGAFALIVAIVAVCCVSHFVGFFECVGSKKYDYTMQEIHDRKNCLKTLDKEFCSMYNEK